MNHHIVADLHGTWSDGVVRGQLKPTGWGSTLGFPAFMPDPDGEPIGVKLLHSTKLPEHWQRLDEFEGDGYRRVVVLVTCSDGRTIPANIYAAADASGCGDA